MNRRDPLAASFAAFVLLLFSVPAAAQSANRFDVVCEIAGRSVSRHDGVVTTAFTQTARYTVDLTTGQFCNDCAELVFELRVPPTATELNLTHEVWFEGRPAGFDQIFIVNRVTGRARYEHRVGVIEAAGAGPCRREPFSGFPEAVF